MNRGLSSFLVGLMIFGASFRRVGAQEAEKPVVEGEEEYQNEVRRYTTELSNLDNQLQSELVEDAQVQKAYNEARRKSVAAQARADVALFFQERGKQIGTGLQEYTVTRKALDQLATEFPPPFQVEGNTLVHSDLNSLLKVVRDASGRIAKWKSLGETYDQWKAKADVQLGFLVDLSTEVLLVKNDDIRRLVRPVNSGDLAYGYYEQAIPFYQELQAQVHSSAAETRAFAVREKDSLAGVQKTVFDRGLTELKSVRASISDLYIARSKAILGKGVTEGLKDAQSDLIVLDLDGFMARFYAAFSRAILNDSDVFKAKRIAGDFSDVVDILVGQLLPVSLPSRQASEAVRGLKAMEGQLKADVAAVGREPMSSWLARRRKILAVRMVARGIPQAQVSDRLKDVDYMLLMTEIVEPYTTSDAYARVADGLMTKTFERISKSGAGG